MRNNYFWIYSWLLIFLLFGKLSAQGPSDTNPSGLIIHGFSLTEKTVDLQIEIPYGGVVEIFLFNDAEQNVWRNRYVFERGINTISLRRSAFRAEQNYSYQLAYKLSVLSGSIPSFAV